MSSRECRIIEFPKVLDERGTLSFFQDEDQIPFSIARRGSHAYKTLQEVIVALSGSFDVVLHDGDKEMKFQLNRSYYGLYVPNMIWRRLENFSTNSLALVVADKVYDEQEYIRDFEEFQALRK
jgi:uncharacterized RmlC-like cupin family protein